MAVGGPGVLDREHDTRSSASWKVADDQHPSPGSQDEAQCVPAPIESRLGILESMRRALVLLLLAGCAFGLAVASARPHVRGRLEAAAGAWSSPQVLEPASQYTFNPQLAVSEDGDTLAAWNGGPRSLPARAGNAGGLSPSVHQPAWSGSSVVVDTGTVLGGFGPPVTLAEHASDVDNGLYVAISGTGVRDVAWEAHAGGWMIASAAPGQAFTAASMTTALPRSLDTRPASWDGRTCKPVGRRTLT